jgi:hypothetical protein
MDCQTRWAAIAITAVGPVSSNGEADSDMEAVTKGRAVADGALAGAESFRNTGFTAAEQRIIDARSRGDSVPTFGAGSGGRRLGSFVAATEADIADNRSRLGRHVVAFACVCLHVLCLLQRVPHPR